MAPKPPSAETAELIELFKSIGLTQSKAAEAAKSPKSAATLKDIIEKKKLSGKNLDEKTSVLLAAAAVQSSKLGEDERGYAVDAILDGRLKSTDQVSGNSTLPCLLLTLSQSIVTTMQLQSSTSRQTLYQWIRQILINSAVSVSITRHP